MGEKEIIFPDFDFEVGEVLLIDKPYEWTSFDVVGKIRNSIKPLKVKVGHAGTLDPLATGLLILCTGKKTKTIDQIQAQEKEYSGTITFGATRPSYDMETEIDQYFDFSTLSEKDIYEATKQFIGDIQQLPPAHSAIRVGGERLYKKARRGETVELKPRLVSIRSFEITAIDLPVISFNVVCSKGTYIRSLAYDFGKALDNGAYLSSLRRVRIGDYHVNNAYSVVDLDEHIRAIRKEKNEDL
jgi:tRNA pseudouridine55 synthase